MFFQNSNFKNFIYLTQCQYTKYNNFLWHIHFIDEIQLILYPKVCNSITHMTITNVAVTRLIPINLIQ